MNIDDLLALIPAELNEDTRQDVVVALLEAKPSDDASALALIKRTINTVQVRERRYRRRSFAILAEPTRCTEYDPLREAMYAAIDCLDSTDRDLLLGRYELGVPMNLLGQIANVSQPTLRKKLRKAEENVRQAFIG